MNIIVVVQQVPDLVEELEIDASGKDLDREWLKVKINEFDDHALEEALQMKAEYGGEVTVIALESQDIDKTLYTAAAKGADKLIKVCGDFSGVSSHAAAKALSKVLSGMSYDLIFCGVQAADDRDGQVAVCLATYLGLSHISVVTHIALSGDTVTVHKEYGGGMMAAFEAKYPLVLGIQAARQTPRYAAVSKVRRAMKTTKIEEITAQGDPISAGSEVRQMFKPTTTGGAEMLEGSEEEIVNRIMSIIKEKGIKA